MTLERKPILNLDDWENALDEQITKYSSVFEVDYDQEYVVKVLILLRNVNIRVLYWCNTNLIVHLRLDLVNMVLRPLLFTKTCLFTKLNLDKE